MRNRPPGRGSVSAECSVKPSGPNQRSSWRASVHAAKTRSRGASRTRVRLTVLSRFCILLFGEALQIAQAGLELAADHLVHVDKDVNDLGKVGNRPLHAPSHLGRAALRREQELDLVVRL